MSLLRPATRPPKPRIRKTKGGWLCKGGGTSAAGPTPEDAYRAWSHRCALKGAEIMRRLLPLA